MNKENKRWNCHEIDSRNPSRLTRLYSSSADWPLMTKTTTPTKTATTKTSSATLTGAYTATETPKNAAGKANPPLAFHITVILGAALLPVMDWI